MATNISHESGPQTVSVRIGTGHFATHISSSGHQLLADEPEEVGGTDLGPTPQNLLLSSLGACTAITVRMYADHKQWPLEEILLELSQSQVQASELVESHPELDSKGRITVINMAIQFKGDLLTEEMIERLSQIANKCPVHRTLVGPTLIKTQFEAA